MGATPSAPVVLTQTVITAADPVNCGTPGRIESDLQRVPSDATPLLMGIDIGTMCVLNGIAWIVKVLTTPGLPTEAHEWLRLFVIFACSACEQGVVTKASLVPLLQLLHEAFVTWRTEAEHGANLHGLAEDEATSMFDGIFTLANAARLTFEQRPLTGPVLGEFAVSNPSALVMRPWHVYSAAVKAVAALILGLAPTNVDFGVRERDGTGSAILWKMHLSSRFLCNNELFDLSKLEENRILRRKMNADMVAYLKGEFDAAMSIATRAQLPLSTMALIEAQLRAALRQADGAGADAFEASFLSTLKSEATLARAMSHDAKVKAGRLELVEAELARLAATDDAPVADDDPRLSDYFTSVVQSATGYDDSLVLEWCAKNHRVDGEESDGEESDAISTDQAVAWARAGAQLAHRKHEGAKTFSFAHRGGGLPTLGKTHKNDHVAREAALFGLLIIGDVLDAFADDASLGDDWRTVFERIESTVFELAAASKKKNSFAVVHCRYSRTMWGIEFEHCWERYFRARAPTGAAVAAIKAVAVGVATTNTKELARKDKSGGYGWTPVGSRGDEAVKQAADGWATNVAHLTSVSKQRKDHTKDAEAWWSERTCPDGFTLAPFGKSSS